MPQLRYVPLRCLKTNEKHFCQDLVGRDHLTKPDIAADAWKVALLRSQFWWHRLAGAPFSVKC
jgi:hypothetical protein